MKEKSLPEMTGTLLDDELPDARREEAALALGQLGDAALPTLRRLLQADAAEHRWWATRTLAANDAPAAVPLLIETLFDPDPDVRACAALALGTLAASEAVGPLIRLLADQSAYVCRIAGNALIQIGAPAVPALIEALNSESPAARAGAARALIPLESPEAIPALFAALDDPSALVTYYAEQALERLGVGMVFVIP